MAKSKESSVSSATDKPEEKIPSETAGDAGRAQPQAQQQGVRVDDSKLIAMYANFCRVTGTPEELIIDFGLNPQPFGVPTEPVVVNQRIVTNFYTAKRLLHLLGQVMAQHEATFGVLELDAQRRARTTLRTGTPPISLRPN